MGRALGKTTTTFSWECRDSFEELDLSHRLLFPVRALQSSRIALISYQLALPAPYHEVAKLPCQDVSIVMV